MNPFTDAAAPAGAWGSTASFTIDGGSAKKGNDAGLAAREAELKQKEGELQKREAELRSGGGGRRVTKNWPACCPVLHHDIAGDVPAASQAVVRCAYWAFLGLLLCLFVNFVGTIAVLIAVDGDNLSSFLWAALYVVGGVPGALFGWYFRLYSATAKDSGFAYAFFFAGFLAHLVFTGWSAVAPPLLNSWSHTGFWTAKDVIIRNTGAGIIYYVGAGLWSLEFLWSFKVLTSVYSNFRGRSAQQNAPAAGAGAV